MACRICGANTDTVLDLGTMPPANRLKESREEEERRYPLVLEKCASCLNLQLRDCVDEGELYSRYLYLTPDSPSLTAHYGFLTDRIGNVAELEPYFEFWAATPCKDGVLEIIVIEHDAESFDVPRIQKGTDGRSLL